MNRRHVSIGSFVALVALAAAWWAFQRTPGVPEPAKTVPAVQTASEPVEPAPKPGVPAQDVTVAGPHRRAKPANTEYDRMARELPGPLVPFDQRIAALRELAAAGNNVAQIALSDELGKCTARGRRTAAEKEKDVRAQAAKDAADRELTDARRKSIASMHQYQFDEFAIERATCNSLPAELVEHWLDPIERAANSGSTYAMRRYAALAIADYDTVGAVVADVDTAILRRDKARAYLQEALRLGDEETLSDLAFAYFTIQLNVPRAYALDYFRAYVYAYAGTLAGPRSPGEQNALDNILMQSSEHLNPSQVAQAQVEGRRVHQACCQGH